MLRWTVAVFTSLLVAGCGVGPPSAARSPAPSGPVFYAAASSQAGDVVAVSAVTGQVVGKVAAGHRDGMGVVGISAAGPGALLVTYSQGPRCTSGIAGCGPAPHSCGAQVVRVPLDGAPGQLLWQVDADQLLSSAALSPDGSTIAAAGGPCVPSYFNSHLVMRRVSDATTWTIGAGVARCHIIGAPTWLADSTHVLTTYAAPIGKPYTGQDGTCEAVGDNQLVVVDATGAQDGVAGTTLAPPASCTWQANAATSTALYAVAACGPDDGRLQGPAKLVELSPALKVGHSWPIGDCTDGNSLAADDTLDVLVTAYLFCNPPLHSQPLGQPDTVLQCLHDGNLQQIADGAAVTTDWRYVAW